MTPNSISSMSHGVRDFCGESWFGGVKSVTDRKALWTVSFSHYADQDSLYPTKASYDRWLATDTCPHSSFPRQFLLVTCYATSGSSLHDTVSYVPRIWSPPCTSYKHLYANRIYSYLYRDPSGVREAHPAERRSIDCSSLSFTSLD